MTFASIVASMALQLVAIVLQNEKRGVKKVVFEALPVLIGLKPAVDAYRIAGNLMEEAGGAFDNMTEMVVMKTAELFAEAIPGVIIQLLAILTSEMDTTAASWLSLGASVLSAGFICASISYDYDTDPGECMQEGRNSAK